MDDQLLAQLRPLHLPDPVGWWPPAPGWWLVAALLAALGAATLLLLRRRRQQAYRRAAISRLAQVLDRAKREGRSTAVRQYLQDCSAILRHTALQTYRREVVAPLAGEAWAGFLAATSNSPETVDALSDALSTQLYQPSPECELQRVHEQAVAWVRHHPTLDNHQQSLLLQQIRARHEGLARC